MRIISNQINWWLTDHQYHSIFLVIKAFLHVYYTNIFTVIFKLFVSIIIFIKHLMETISLINYKWLSIFCHIKSLMFINIRIFRCNAFTNLTMHKRKTHNLTINRKCNLLFALIIKKCILECKLHISLYCNLFQFHY